MFPFTKEGREATATTSEDASHPQDPTGNDSGGDVAKVGGAKEVRSIPGV